MRVGRRQRQARPPRPSRARRPRHAPETERGEEVDQRLGEPVEAVPVPARRGLLALAEARQVGHDDAEALGQARQDVVPRHPARQVVVHEDERGPAPGLDEADARPAGGDVTRHRLGGVGMLRRHGSGHPRLASRKIDATAPRGEPMGGHELEHANGAGRRLRRRRPRYELLRRTGRGALGATSTRRARRATASSGWCASSASPGRWRRTTPTRSARRPACSPAYATPTSSPCSRSARTPYAGPFLVLELVDGLDLRSLAGGLSARRPPGGRRRGARGLRPAAGPRRRPAVAAGARPPRRHASQRARVVARRGQARRLRHRPGAGPHALDAAALREGQARLHVARADPGR